MNTKRLQKSGKTFCLTVTLALTLCGSRAALGQTIQPKYEEYGPLADMRAAGIRGDRSQIPAMIKALNPKLTAYHWMTALRALSELQATEAIPAIDAMIESCKGDTTAGFARVVKARILAEASTDTRPVSAQVRNRVPFGGLPSNVVIATESPARAEVTLNRFMGLLNLTTAKLKATMTKPANGPAQFVTTDPERTAVWAQQEIGDMALRSDPAYLTLPAVKALDFTLYEGALLKMKVAPMSHEERVKWLVDELSRKKSLRGEDNGMIQLAIDEGLPASHYAVTVLKAMSKHQKDYAPMGFHALFMVLSGVADKTDSAIIATFASNDDPGISHYSGEYPHFKVQAATGY